MNRRRTWLALLLSGSFLVSGSAAAGAIESSYRTARKVIDGSIASMEADRWLGRPVPLLMEASGTFFQGAEHQGYAPDEPTPAPFAETWAFDPASGAVGREYRQQRPDGTSEWMREIYPGGDELLLIDLNVQRALRLQGSHIARGRDRNLRRFPPLLLQEARRNPRALRSMGRYGPFDSVQAQTRHRESLSLFFGRESRTLGWVEYLADLPTFGDSTVSWKFSDYRPVEGVGRLPFHYGIFVNEATLTDMTVQRIVTDPEKVRAFLALPDGIARPESRVIPDNWSPMSRAGVEQIGDGVYRIANLRTGFHTLFVEFDTFVLMVDAPTGYPLLAELPAGDVMPGYTEMALSEHAIGLVREAVGDKPLKYLVLTHWHNDHAGGLLAYADLHPKLLVHASELEAVRTFLGSEHTLCPYERPASTFTLESVNKRRVISDGSQRVELLDVGENPHTAHMLVVWLPRQKILYVADLLTGSDGTPDEQHADLNRHFLMWVERRHLKPAVIVTAHGDGFVYPESRPLVASQQTLMSPKDP
jgi:glyoxylase-like metal-dependent hydrolase (beta-lactamase superfamily II)